MPEVSVVIPTRDREQLLLGTVASAAAQQDVNLELIIVDDGSALRVSSRIGDDYNGVPTRVLRHDTPRGVASARNTGIDAARGRWVAFLDDDDLWAPSKLATQRDAAQNVGADFVYTAGVIIDIHGRLVANANILPETHNLHEALLCSNAIPCGCSNLMCLRTAALGLLGFDPAFSMFADWDFHLRLSESAYGVGVPKRLVAYTIHPGSMHLNEEQAVRELALFERKHAVKRAGKCAETRSYLRWRASSYRTAGDRKNASRAYLRLALHDRRVKHAILALAMRTGLDRARLRPGRANLQIAAAREPKWLQPVLDLAQRSTDPRDAARAQGARRLTRGSR